MVLWGSPRKLVNGLEAERNHPHRETSQGVHTTNSPQGLRLPVKLLRLRWGRGPKRRRKPVTWHSLLRYHLGCLCLGAGIEAGRPSMLEAVQFCSQTGNQASSTQLSPAGLHTLSQPENITDRILPPSYFLSLLSYLAKLHDPDERKESWVFNYKPCGRLEAKGYRDQRLHPEGDNKTTEG